MPKHVDVNQHSARGTTGRKAARMLLDSSAGTHQVPRGLGDGVRSAPQAEEDEECDPMENRRKEQAELRRKANAFLDKDPLVPSLIIRQ
eukprot:6712500-Pyramimonas_sp.AAC.1